jgi:hypothetical protein
VGAHGTPAGRAARVTGMYYDRQGHPMDLQAWAAKHADMDYRVVRQDHIDGHFVSTIRLGLDHSFLGGPPLIFETMIFDQREDANSYAHVYCERYTSEDAARVGHDRAIEWLREQLGPKAIEGAAPIG